MSQCVLIDPLIISVSLLLEGIRELSFSVRELNKLTDSQGHSCDVDFVIENELGEKIGVRKRSQQPIELILANPESATARKSVDRIKQSYSRLKVLDEVKHKGYQKVKEEKLPDGSIRLVVQRWR